MQELIRFLPGSSEVEVQVEGWGVVKARVQVNADSMCKIAKVRAAGQQMTRNSQAGTM
jgi:hypothetical protein